MTTPEHTRRLGKFSISWVLIDDNPQVVRQLLSKMIIVRAETLYHDRSIEYIAMCDDFDVIPEGMIVPQYDIEIDERVANITKLETIGIRKLILVPSEEVS